MERYKLKAEENNCDPGVQTLLDTSELLYFNNHYCQIDDRLHIHGVWPTSWHPEF